MADPAPPAPLAAPAAAAAKPPRPAAAARVARDASEGSGVRGRMELPATPAPDWERSSRQMDDSGVRSCAEYLPN